MTDKQIIDVLVKVAELNDSTFTYELIDNITQHFETYDVTQLEYDRSDKHGIYVCDSHVDVWYDGELYRITHKTDVDTHFVKASLLDKIVTESPEVYVAGMYERSMVELSSDLVDKVAPDNTSHVTMGEYTLVIPECGDIIATLVSRNVMHDPDEILKSALRELYRNIDLNGVKVLDMLVMQVMMDAADMVVTFIEPTPDAPAVIGRDSLTVRSKEADIVIKHPNDDTYFLKAYLMDKFFSSGSYVIWGVDLVHTYDLMRIVGQGDAYMDTQMHVGDDGVDLHIDGYHLRCKFSDMPVNMFNVTTPDGVTLH